MACDPKCLACFKHDWDFFAVPDKHFSGGTPDCVLRLGDGPDYDGDPCICVEAAVQRATNISEGQLMRMLEADDGL